MRDPVKLFDGYVDGVLDGSVPACKFVRWAVQRHLRDMERSDIFFDVEGMRLDVEFFRCMVHQRGRLAGKPFDPEPWQVFVIGSVYSWRYRATGRRRFQRVGIFVPRKNGKTFLAAGAGLHGLVFDGEAGAEVYCAATTRDQARELFDPALAIVEGSPSLRRRITPNKNALLVKGTLAKMVPLARDSKKMDGKNPHIALIDEYHEHTDRGIVEVMSSGMGARQNPILWIITTAGFNLQSVCKQEQDLLEQILDPDSDIDDDRQFAFIATLDEGDSWEDPASWMKANPNYGVSVEKERFEVDYQEAKNLPSAQNNFLTKRLNVWCGQAKRWLPMDDWKICEQEEITDDMLRGLTGFGAIDLSSVSDITAWVTVWPLQDGRLAVRGKYWVPGKNARIREHRDRVPYARWARDGFVTLTEGNAIDYRAIRRDILEDIDHVCSLGANVAAIGYDPWGATETASELADAGLNMVHIRQGYQSLSGPSKELERRVLSHQILTGHDPCLRWMASNVATETDPAGNIKPSKRKSSEKIDGIVALIMAIGVASVGEEPFKSSYEDEELFLL